MDSLDNDAAPPSYHGVVNPPNEKHAFPLSQDEHDASGGGGGEVGGGEIGGEVGVATDPALPPPAYDSFEDAHAAWTTASKAKQALVSLEKDPPFCNVEERVEKAKDKLKRLRTERCVEEVNRCFSFLISSSEAAFKALHPKRSIASFFHLGKSRWKLSQHEEPRAEDDGVDPAAKAFKRAQEAEERQEETVLDLEEKLTEFKRKVSPLLMRNSLEVSTVLATERSVESCGSY
jgi:hypothetical protein